MSEAQFREDFLHWHGRSPTGKFQHWCPDWDQLPIDDTCEEFQCCTCKKQKD